MTERAEAAAAIRASGAARAAASTRERTEWAVFAAATVAAWAHTIDEIGIGEVVAVPFGAANAAAVPPGRG